MFPRLRHTLLVSLALTSPLAAADWWNPAWSQRQPVTLDAGPDAAALTGPVESIPVLVRLHDGNFRFDLANGDGADLRFVSADGKNVFPHQVEKYDGLLNEAFVWVRVPSVDPAAKSTVHLYYGGGDPAVAAPDSTTTWGSDQNLVYHFDERGTPPADSSANGNHAEAAAATADGAIIGSALRLMGIDPLVIPASDSLAWTQGQDLTWSAWVRPAVLQTGAILFSRGEGDAGFRLLLDQGVPFLETAGSRSPAGEPVAATTWFHLAVVSEGGNLRLIVNGEPYSSLAGTLPALDGPLALGGPVPGTAAIPGTEPFNGEIDELRIAGAARSDDWIRFSAINQGATEAAQRSLFLGEVEGDAAEKPKSEMLEHVMLFGDIANNMMFDGWIAVGVCILMIIVGWTVAAKKWAYLNSIHKGTEEFLKLWKRLSYDLTAIDHADDESVRSFGGKADPASIALVEKSPLYQIYHIGSEEIRHRLARDKERTKGLSGRSIQAIRAALDAGLVRAQHKLTNGLVYLTISIAGGPYVGLLGTVVGVMITFAIIAKSGEVEVNSIAPGIASALLATVAGLVVAIPALFIYSYLNGRIKNTIAEMHVFIDEFVAKMAEFYPPEGENSPYSPAPAPVSSPPSPAPVVPAVSQPGAVNSSGAPALG